MASVPRNENSLAQTSFKVTVDRDLEAHAAVWPTLANAHLHNVYAFQCRDHIAIWLASMGKARKTEACFVRVDDAEGTPLMLLALGIERSGGVRQLVFLDGGVADYNAPVLFAGAAALDNAAMTMLWRQIVAALPGFDVVRFTKMPAKVGSVDNPLLHLGVTPDRSSAYQLALVGDRAKSKKGGAEDIALFKDSKRQRRRLAEIGEVTYRVARTEEERAEFLAVMKRQKRRRYLETRGVDGFQRPGYLDYYDTMTRQLGASGHVSLSALYVGEVAVAAQWSIATANRLIFLMPSFEAGEWAKHSPGSLLLEHVVNECRRSGHDVFDMGVGDEPYKVRIGSDRIPLFRLEQPKTLAGRVYIGSNKLRQHLSDGPLGERWRAAKLAWRARKVSKASAKPVQGD